MKAKKNVSSVLPTSNLDVAFVDVKTGVAFFTCSAAEARKVKKELELVRANADTKEMKDFKSGIAKVKDRMWAILTSLNDPNKTLITSTDMSLDTDKQTIWGLTAPILSYAFSVFESKSQRVSSILMNPMDYTCLRRYERSILDIETEVWKMKTGVFAYVWGAEIIVDSKCPKGTVIYYSEDVNRFYVVEYLYDPNSDNGRPEPTEKEMLQEILSRLDQMSTAPNA